MPPNSTTPSTQHTVIARSRFSRDPGDPIFWRKTKMDRPHEAGDDE
jgi:hypothetical protein